MDNVNNTLYIPLYGKALVSRLGIILHDPKAEEIWSAEGFPLKGKSSSKWLAYYMSMRAAVFDRWVAGKMEQDPGAVVLHLGCGMDSRVLRLGTQGHQWYDVDFPDVIAQRQRYYEQTQEYQMLAANVAEQGWLEAVPGGDAIVIMEGISMYLPEEALKRLIGELCGHFQRVSLLMDCYTTFAAKASKVKNPINDVGVTQVYGMDDPKKPECGGLRFVQKHTMTPANLIEELPSGEKWIFKKLYAGSVAEKCYRLYEYRKEP